LATPAPFGAWRDQLRGGADEHPRDERRQESKDRPARAQGLLRVLAATFTGDHNACRVVNVPSVADEDAKRQHREREYLVQERVRIENRIAALLATQGISKRPSLRSWETDLNALQTGDGRSIPPLLKAELSRLRRRLVITLDMIREVETERQQALETQNDDASQTIGAL
jgi:transposase